MHNFNTDNNKYKILFASQREYFHSQDGLFTVGPIGAETGENFRSIFPEMILVGRLGKQRNAKQAVPAKNFYLMELNLRSPKILFNFFIISYRIFNILKNIDGVIVRAGGLGTLVAFISIMMRKPTGIEVGGCVFNSLWNYGNIFGKIFAYPSFFLRRFLLSRADKVQMVTQEYLQKRYIHTSKIKECIGISNVSIRNKHKSVLVERKKKNPFHNGVVLGSIGSFNGSFKGHDIAVETCKILNNKGIKTELRILGAGDKMNLLKKIHSENMSEKVILFDPLSPGAEVEDWLDKIDIYCQFSRREGVSRALIEAMNLAIPVVASNAGGTYELVDKRSIFPINDAFRASQIIENLILDKNFFIKICEHSFYKAKEFDLKKLNEKRYKFWHDFGRVVENSQK